MYKLSLMHVLSYCFCLKKKPIVFFDVPVLVAVAVVVAKAWKQLNPFFENFELSKVPDNSMLLFYSFHYRFILR